MRSAGIALLITSLGCEHRVYLDDEVCSGKGGPVGVRVEGTCIDSTEVTRGQYAVFLAEVKPTTLQDSNCTWNDSFVPDVWPMPTGTELYPVGGVDFCDATAFCHWAGKRLCGHVGGGAVYWRERDVASANEWYLACSARATTRYPYGDIFGPTPCAVSGEVQPVGSMPTCQGGYAGVFDMIGNVWEWTDSCDSEADDPSQTLCDRRGGATTVMPQDFACEDGELLRRSARQDDIGIRCCSD
jgi:formylglycine-generating enzyme required for sulfatase activity